MEEIDVVYYSGYKGEETPLHFTFGNVRYDIQNVLERSVEETLTERETVYRFRVLCTDNREYTLVFQPASGQWRLLN